MTAVIDLLRSAEVGTFEDTDREENSGNWKEESGRQLEIRAFPVSSVNFL